ncbi:hypothetical protein [Hyalangium gracile]|uniref:hypothetical protein n=1 Tax=Hyalangium gracile TaxID=394092 RepID=UPI001CCA9336|nr:hypothetical protein [Hyalangium gracile]
MIKNIVSVAVAMVGSGALLTGCNFDQPDAGCIVQDASSYNWVVKYDLKEGEVIAPGCETKINALKGENLGVFKFTDPEKENSAVLTLRPQGLYSRASRDPGDPYMQTAVGKLDEEPDPQDFCGAREFSAATVNAAANASEAATAITYQFDNVKVFAAPSAPGTQLSADLTYTRDGCTAKFNVRAMWPARGCNADAPKQSDRCGEGSGINPDFAVTCDMGFRVNTSRDQVTGEPLYMGSCIPEKAIPSFKDDQE